MLVAAREHHLDRHTGRLGQPRGNNHFGSCTEFRAEAAAEELADYAHIVGWQTEIHRQIVARGKNTLRRAPNRELVSRRVEARNRAVRLEADVRLHGRRVGSLDRVRRDLESSRDVADARSRGPAHVGSAAENARGGIRHCAVHINHEPHRFVIDFDQLERVGGQIGTDGGNRCDFLAGETDFAIFKCKNRAHAFEMLSRGQIDVANPRVRPRTAQDRAVKHPRQFDIVSVTRSAGRFQWSVNARRGLADHGQALAPLPRRRLVVGNDDRDLARVALKAEVERDAPRHQASFAARTERADLAGAGLTALRAAAKTCG